MPPSRRRVLRPTARTIGITTKENTTLTTKNMTVSTSAPGCLPKNSGAYTVTAVIPVNCWQAIIITPTHKAFPYF